MTDAILPCGLALLWLIWLADRIEAWARLSPVEQNLQRASHGLAYMLFALLAAYLFGPRLILGTLPLVFGNHPVDAWPGAAFVGVFVWALVRFIFGLRRARGFRDGILATRALVKLTAGVGIVWYVWRTFPFAITGMSWRDLALQAVIVAGLWCVITGTVRFVLMVGIGGGSAYGAVASHITATNFQWGAPQPRRPWWKFW
jgi:hypothetical protein